MFSRIEKLQARLEDARSVKELEPLLKELASDCGFPYFLLAWTRLLPASLRLQGIPDIITNFPEEWMKRYWKRRYYKDDCVLNRCLRCVLPVVWNEQDGRPPLTARQRRIAAEAAKHGLAIGISAPVHGPGGQFAIFCLSRFRLAGQSPAEASGFVHLAAAHIHSTLWSLIGDPCGKEAVPVELKPVESACLTWSARGKTSREIGDILSISERTVYFHVGNAIEHLGARNRKHAIFLAIKAGLIEP